MIDRKWIGHELPPSVLPIERSRLQFFAKARALAPTLPIIARAHSDEEVAHLKYHGANVVIMGEQEIAKAMLLKIGATMAV